MSLESTKAKTKQKPMRRLRYYIARVFIFIACILLIGFSFELIEGYRDTKKYPSTGKTINVNSHKIHLFSKGEGKSTVVFTGGLQNPSAYVDFYPLYNEISNHARIVAYDRPGHGWSEVTDKPRDVDTIVKEMHTALTESGEKPPYILVSHSLASLEVIRFAQMYRNEVSGIIMIDSGNPEFYHKNNLKFKETNILTYRFMKYSGLIRFIAYNTNYYAKFIAPMNNLEFLPNDLKELYLSMIIKTMYNKNIIDEARMANDNAKTVLDNGHLGNLPLRILTSESNSLITEWKNSQETLKEWSTDSKQMIVKGSRHSVHQYSPDVINNEIIELINKQ